MSPRWLVIPALLLLTGCAGLDPAAAYRVAARQLRFTLDQVDPSLHLAYPLDQSRLGLRLTVGIENPTEVRFRARSITGHISLDSDGASHAVGQLSFAQGVDLKPATRTPVRVDLSFSYSDLRQAWGSLRMVSQGARPGTWKLDGEVGLEVLGIPLTAPLHIQRRASGQ